MQHQSLAYPNHLVHMRPAPPVGISREDYVIDYYKHRILTFCLHAACTHNTLSFSNLREHKVYLEDYESDAKKRELCHVIAEHLHLSLQDFIRLFMKDELSLQGDTICFTALSEALFTKEQQFILSATQQDEPLFDKRRRHYFLFEANYYVPEFCPNVLQGGTCSHGHDCVYARDAFELAHHPEKYLASQLERQPVTSYDTALATLRAIDMSFMALARAQKWDAFKSTFVAYVKQYGAPQAIAMIMLDKERYSQNTALHYLAFHSQLTLLQLIIETATFHHLLSPKIIYQWDNISNVIMLNLNVGNAKLLTPLYAAMRSVNNPNLADHQACIKFLIKYGANPYLYSPNILGLYARSIARRYEIADWQSIANDHIKCSKELAGVLHPCAIPINPLIILDKAIKIAMQGDNVDTLQQLLDRLQSLLPLAPSVTSRVSVQTGSKKSNAPKNPIPFNTNAASNQPLVRTNLTNAPGLFSYAGAMQNNIIRTNFNNELKDDLTRILTIWFIIDSGFENGKTMRDTAPLMSASDWMNPLKNTHQVKEIHDLIAKIDVYQTALNVPFLHVLFHALVRVDLSELALLCLQRLMNVESLSHESYLQIWIRNCTIQNDSKETEHYFVRYFEYLTQHAPHTFKDQIILFLNRALNRYIHASLACKVLLALTFDLKEVSHYDTLLNVAIYAKSIPLIKSCYLKACQDGRLSTNQVQYLMGNEVQKIRLDARSTDLLDLEQLFTMAKIYELITCELMRTYFSQIAKQQKKHSVNSLLKQIEVSYDVAISLPDMDDRILTNYYIDAIQRISPSSILPFFMECLAQYADKPFLASMRSWLEAAKMQKNDIEVDLHGCNEVVAYCCLKAVMRAITVPTQVTVITGSGTHSQTFTQDGLHPTKSAVNKILLQKNNFNICDIEYDAADRLKSGRCRFVVQPPREVLSKDCSNTIKPNKKD